MKATAVEKAIERIVNKYPWDDSKDLFRTELKYLVALAEREKIQDHLDWKYWIEKCEELINLLSKYREIQCDHIRLAKEEKIADRECDCDVYSGTGMACSVCKRNYPLEKATVKRSDKST